MGAIQDILQKEFPELHVEIPSIPVGGDCSIGVLGKAVRYIKERKLVQDSIQLLSTTEPFRESVIYPVLFPNSPNNLQFQVTFMQPQMLYLGCIQLEANGKPKVQARFYDMRLNLENK